MSRIDDILAAAVEDALADLLETKHLYQSVKISVLQVLRKVGKSLSGTVNSGMETAVRDALERPWHLHDGISIQRPHHAMPDGTEFPPAVYIYLQRVKAVCSVCKQRMPMTLSRALDAHEVGETGFGKIEAPVGTQDFLFLFQCQSCVSAPDAFLVRRKCDKLTLCGRAPIGHVEIPRDTPEGVRKFYRSSVVASQSGQALASLFLLRVVIEQHVRNEIEEASGRKIDRLLDEYMAMLPADFNSRFPSLKDIYGRLSTAIHSAEESSPLFNQCIEEVDLHFRALKLYEQAKEFREGSPLDATKAEPSAGADG